MSIGPFRLGGVQWGLAVWLGLAIGPALAAQSFGPVKAGRGIYAVAAEFRDRQGDLNLRQWALAIYALNPDAFSAGLGSLRSGSRLLIPSEAEVRQLWRHGKALEGGAEPALVAQQVAAVMNQASSPAADSIDGEVVGYSSSGPELAAPQPDFFWFVPSPSEDTSARGSGPGQAPDVAKGQPETAGPGAEPLDPDAEAEGAQAVGDLSVDGSDDEAPIGRFADTEWMNQARSAVGSDDADIMLARMRQLESRYAGDLDFDYIFGVLLIDAGDPQEAIYPLLRAYEEDPSDLGIRLDLGRAYFDAGENESARSIFGHLATQDPPPRTALVIDSYLKAIERRAGRYERRLSTQLALRSGTDSNANNASSLTEFAGFFLDDAARSQESPFAVLSAETGLTQPLGPRLNLQVGGEASTRQYFDAPEFSSTRWGLSTGLSFRRGDLLTALNLKAGQNYVDGEQNHDYGAIAAGAQWRFGVNRRVNLNGKFGGLRYADGLTIRDVDQSLISLGFSQHLNWAFGSEFGVDLAAGQDEAVETNSPYSRDLMGGSIRGLVQLRPALRVSVSSHYLVSDYDGRFAGTGRKDEQWFTDLTVELNHNRWKNWTAEVFGRFVDNTSSVALYEYDRLELGLGLRWLLD